MVVSFVQAIQLGCIEEFQQRYLSPYQGRRVESSGLSHLYRTELKESLTSPADAPSILAEGPDVDALVEAGAGPA